MLRWRQATLPLLLVTAGPAAAYQSEVVIETADEQNEAQSAAGAEIEAIMKELQDAQAAFMEKYRAADEETQKTLRNEYPNGEELVPRMWEVVKRHKGDPACAEGLGWIVSSAGPDEQVKALGMMVADFPEDEGLPRLLGRLRPGEQSIALLRRVANHDNVALRAHGTYQLANTLKSVPGIAKRLEQLEEDQRQGYIDYMGEKAIAFSKTANASALEEESMSLLEKVVNDESLASVILYRDRTIGKVAAGDLFEFRNLREGLIAPEIEGEDVDVSRSSSPTTAARSCSWTSGATGEAPAGPCTPTSGRS